ncbi:MULTISPECIES: hypothetical protein [unclassified Streptomyces]|uniref:hypothetical protein n=1 Tax=unclassified Streptomyces TaxID=2593676 RepID=UPI00226DF726|nr:MULTISPECIES: hypothetical protein [unclassified Streptomyces]MCY0923441.1 hypothetical protein [Streptomyces sp. H27-G5]MCY0963309.1 hypothetical protein [Streptomyces sp. H27-H5]
MSGATDLWGEWQKHGARGMSGAQALAAEIDRIAGEGGIATPVTAKRGLSARLRYLSSGPGRQVLDRNGISARLLRSWNRGARPSRAKLDAVDKAYQEHRRANLVRSGALKRLLDNGGRGRRIEIYPVDQTLVDEKRRRPTVSERSVQARYIWDDAVDAWSQGDLAALDEIWDDVITDLDSDYAAYAYVGSIGIGA